MTPDEIRHLRTSRGIKMLLLADLVGVRRQSIVRWEAGLAKPTEEHVERLEAIRRLVPDTETVRKALQRLRSEERRPAGSGHS